jgi:hypothetical protein
MNPSSFAVATLLLLSLTAVRNSNCEPNEEPPVLTKFPFENTVPLKIAREAIPSLEAHSSADKTGLSKPGSSPGRFSAISVSAPR